MFSFLRSTDISSVELVVVSKDDCHLCDVALEKLEQLQRRHGFSLQVVKTHEGDEWYDRYQDKVPVGLVNGTMIFKYQVEEKDLLQKLRSRREI
jgi:hypothetical protein